MIVAGFGKASLFRRIVILFDVMSAIEFMKQKNDEKKAMLENMRSLGKIGMVAMTGTILIHNRMGTQVEPV